MSKMVRRYLTRRRDDRILEKNNFQNLNIKEGHKEKMSYDITSNVILKKKFMG